MNQLLIALEKQNESFLNLQNILERTDGPTYTQEIRCEIEKINSFGPIIHAYRSMQPENMVFPTPSHPEKEMFEPITADDLYRAGLTYEIGLSEVYNTHEMGEYFIYTECGYFDWKFIIPLAGVMVVLIILYIVAMVNMRKRVQITVPYNSKTWFDEMIKRVQVLESENSSDSNTPRISKWKKNVDEVVLLHGDSANMNVGYCRDGAMIRMDDVLPEIVDSIPASNFELATGLRARSVNSPDPISGRIERMENEN